MPSGKRGGGIIFSSRLHTHTNTHTGLASSQTGVTGSSGGGGGFRLDAEIIGATLLNGCLTFPHLITSCSFPAPHRSRHHSSGFNQTLACLSATESERERDSGAGNSWTNPPACVKFDTTAGLEVTIQIRVQMSSWSCSLSFIWASA